MKRAISRLLANFGATLKRKPPVRAEREVAPDQSERLIRPDRFGWEPGDVTITPAPRDTPPDQTP